MRGTDLGIKIVLLVEEDGPQVIGFPRALATHDNGRALMEVLIDPVVPLEQPVHDVCVFEVDVHGIDGTEWFVFCDVGAYGIEQESILLTAEQS